MSPKIAATLPRFVSVSAALVLPLLVAGCAHTYNVKVDALCNSSVRPGSSYRIVAHDEVKADFSPDFDQTLRLVDAALAARGFFPAPNPRDAELVIEVDYGIGSKRRRAVEDAGLFDYSASSRRGTTASNPSANLGNAFNGPEPVTEPVPQTRVTVITLYEKYLTLSARETDRATRGLHKPAELWRITVAVEDTKESVDECMPVLVATAADRIGTSTGARERVRVSERAPAVVLAKGDL